MNPQERKRLLKKRARRELEKAGYSLKQENGCITVFGKTGKAIAEFEDIVRLGQVFGLWGSDVMCDDSTVPPARDPAAGKDSPELAAVREKMHETAPPPQKPSTKSQVCGRGKAARAAHRNR